MKRVLCLCLCLLLLACVPTPSEEVIVNKSDGSMVHAITAPKAEAARYDAPARWEETVSLKNLKIRFDADVTLPEGNVYPVQTVRRHEFMPEDVIKLLNTCFPGPFELRENRYSMAEIEEEIRLLLRGNLVDWDDETGDVVWEPFGGLFTAALAARALGRRCYSAESDDGVFDAGRRRVEKELRKMRMEAECPGTRT